MVQSSLKAAQLTNNKTPLLAYFLLTISVIALAFTTILIKISLFDISADATLFNRLWIATILFGAWNSFQGVRPSTAPAETLISQTTSSVKDHLWLLLVSFLHVTGRFCLTWSLTQTSVVNATMLGNLPPIFTTLGAWLILKQRFNNQFILGMAIALAGALTLGIADLSTVPLDAAIAGPLPIMGDAAALSSAVFFAASCLITERLRSRLDTQHILLGRCCLGAVVMFPVVLLAGGPLFPTTPRAWVAVIGLAVICEALGHGLVVYSLRYLSAAFINVFLLLESVLAAVLAYLIFAEALGPLTLITFAMILGGVLLAKESRDGETSSG